MPFASSKKFFLTSYLLLPTITRINKQCLKKNSWHSFTRKWKWYEQAKKINKLQNRVNYRRRHSFILEKWIWKRRGRPLKKVEKSNWKKEIVDIFPRYVSKMCKQKVTYNRIKTTFKQNVTANIGETLKIIWR